MRSVSHPAAGGIDPRAAAACFRSASGRVLAPGAALVVYRLGSDSFETAVLRQAGDRLVVVAAAATDAVGGRDFDSLLLAYLSGRDPVADLAEGTARATLAARVRAARERLSEHEEAFVAVPDTDLELSLTREELESSIRDPVEQSVDLVEEALSEAALTSDEVGGVLLTGGAGRTPLVASVLRRRLGVDPVLPERPETALEEARRTVPAEADAIPRGTIGGMLRRPIMVRAGVIGSSLLVLAAVLAAFGTRLGDAEPPVAGTEAPVVRPGGGEAPTPRSEAPTAEEEDEGDAGRGGGVPPGGTGGAEASEPAPEPTSVEPSGGDEVAAGPVPEVIGMSTADARSALSEAGFAEVALEGRWRSFLDFSYQDCEVIAQEPEPEAEHGHDQSVTLTYSYTGTDGDECEA